MEDDLIRREDALNCFHCWIDSRGDVHEPDEMPEYEAIWNLPSAQPEIVRCKDCTKREYCRTSTVWAIPPKDDWFCADAERRTDDAD